MTLSSANDTTTVEFKVAVDLHFLKIKNRNNDCDENWTPRKFSRLNRHTASDSAKLPAQLLKWIQAKGHKLQPRLRHRPLHFASCINLSLSHLSYVDGRSWDYDNTKVIMDTQTNWKFPHSRFADVSLFFANQLSKLVSDTVKCPIAIIKSEIVKSIRHQSDVDESGLHTITWFRQI